MMENLSFCKFATYTWRCREFQRCKITVQQFEQKNRPRCPRNDNASKNDDLMQNGLPNLMQQVHARPRDRRTLAIAIAASLVLYLYTSHEPLTSPAYVKHLELDEDFHGSHSKLDGSEEANTSAAAFSRMVYVPDLHGDLAQGVNLLQNMGVIDQNGSWISGNTLLVQGGDIVDRGPNSLGLVKLFANLSAQAAASGGRVVNLLGNHELMLLQHDFRYFNKHELATLAAQQHGTHPSGDGSAAGGAQILSDLLSPASWLGKLLRSRKIMVMTGNVSGLAQCNVLVVHAAALPWMLQEAQSILKSKHSTAAPASSTSSDITISNSPHNSNQADMTSNEGSHTSGSNATAGSEHAAAGLGSEGAAAGKDAVSGMESVSEKDAVSGKDAVTEEDAVTGKESVTGWDLIRVLNDAVSAELAACEGRACGRGTSLAGRLLGGDGAVWSREYIQASKDKVCTGVQQVTSQLGVSRIIVGHTIQDAGRASVLCGGKLVMADIGMSAAYGGKLGHGIALQCGARRNDRDGHRPDDVAKDEVNSMHGGKGDSQGRGAASASPCTMSIWYGRGDKEPEVVCIDE